MAKFRVLFEGSHCTVVVGSEKRAEIFSPLETLCLQAQKFHRKIHHKFHHPKSALAMPFLQLVVLSTFFQRLTRFMGLIMTNVLSGPISC